MAVQLFDVEVAPNWFLVLFKHTKTGLITRWEMFNELDCSRQTKRDLKVFLQQHTFVSFNGNNYDKWILSAYLAGFTNEQLFKLSMTIVTSNEASWKVVKPFNLSELDFNHVDLFAIAPGRASLKIYGARLDTPTIKDLPYEPEQPLTFDQTLEAISYCCDDLDLTHRLLTDLLPQIKLRKFLSAQYSIPLMSSGDPQIAQAVFKAELAKLGKPIFKGAIQPKKTYRYKPADYLVFNTQELGVSLDNAIDAEFNMSAKGKLLEPTIFRKHVKWDDLSIKMGSGGLHSCEKAQSIEPTGEEYLCELDVASYYPAIIINNKYYPPSIGEEFIQVYEELTTRRLVAKRSNDKTTADSLKIAANSAYGHFNNVYSPLYDPQQTIQTTVTGQLSLIMLIEMIVTKTGCIVKSANTDGIVVLAPNARRLDSLRKIYSRWERITQYVLEETPYKAIYSKDVNNYLALKEDGTWKGKGTFAGKSLGKNPMFRICTDAIKDYLAHGVPIEDTILNCKNPADFMGVVTSNGGAMWQGESVGKTIRWYMSVVGSQVTRKSNGYNIGFTEQAFIANKMPKTIPASIDYDYYINRSNSLLESMGVEI